MCYVDEVFNKIFLGQKISVKYLSSDDYLESEGMIIKIDKNKKILYLPNIIIPFYNIIEIKPCKI